MKTIKYFLYLFLTLLVITSCDERDFDSPPINIPSYKPSETDKVVTVAELKALYAADAPTKVEDADLVLRARVSANDESGNVYKQLFVQDATGGIILSIDATGLASLYKIGQEVYLRLDGLYIGKYGGEYQIGTLYNGAIGRMTQLEWEGHAHRNGLPDWGNAEVQERVITLKELSTLDATKLANTLVRIEGVTFNNGGVKQFAPTDGPNANEEYVTQDGAQLMVRTSKYANFASDILPTGVGTIAGIMGRYNGTWQFTVRDRADLRDFNAAGGTGTKGNPYNIAESLEKKTSENAVWIKGFIVGTVSGGVNGTNPIDNNNDIIFTGSFMDNTVVLADKADETDYRKLVVVQLPAGSAIRTAVNLLDTPANKGKELLVQGILKDYFGAVSSDTPGATTNYEFDGGTTPSGDGTKEKPYSVANVKALNPQSTTDPVKTGVWAQGFIVGYYNNDSKTMETSAPFSKDENIMLASNPDETDMNNCICIQLPAGDVRNALGLATTPGQVKKEVKVYGDVLKYNTFPGIKNTVAYWLIEENIGIDPPKGEFDVPEISIADVRAMAEGKITENKKIVGVVVSDLVGGNSGSLKNLVISSLDNSTGLMIRVSESSHPYNMGDKIEINVKDISLTNYGKALQLDGVALAKTRKIGTATITPKVTTIADINANYSQYESTVVTVTGSITSAAGGTWYSGTAAGQNNTITKDGSNLILYVTKYATFKGETIPSGEKSVTGIVGRFDTAYQIIIRNTSDVK